MKRKLLFAAALVASALGFNANAQGLEDITASKISNADLSAQDGWTTVTNINNWNKGTSPVTAECWNDNLNRKTYEISRTIHLEAGKYRLTGYGFIRDGGAAKLIAYVDGGLQNEVAIANRTGQFANEPNDMSGAAKAFKANMYNNVLDFTLSDEADVKIGFTGTHSSTAGWFIAGPVKLYAVKDDVSTTYPLDVTHTISRSNASWTAATGTNGVNTYNGADVWVHEVYKESAYTKDEKVISQTLTGLNKGKYEVTFLAALNCAWSKSSVPSSMPVVYAGTQEQAISTVTVQNACSTVPEYTIEDIEVGDDGTLEVGFKTTETGGNWLLFNVKSIAMTQVPLESYKALLAAKVAEAEGYYTQLPTAAKEALKTVVDNNDNDDDAFTTVSQFNTAMSNITTAISTYATESVISAYADYLTLKGYADGISEVSYTEVEEGSHTTFTSAISEQTATVEGVTTDFSTITTAKNALRTALLAYLGKVEPADNNYFDLTFMIVNPSFDDNTNTGWTFTYSAGGNTGVSYTNQESWNNTFNFYQDLTGMPNGSYSLSVQAFSRPGDNGNETSGAYYNFKQNINDVTAELYVNSDASKVGNIYAYTDNTTGAKVAGNDFNCTLGGDNYWVPNNQEGASLYFKDGAYTTSVVALVSDGNLRIGFRDEVYTSHQWTIWDNFQLHYYGSSELYYKKNRLEQLEEQIAADYLNNALYNVLKDGQTERAALQSANAVDGSELSEDELTAATTAIETARDNFVSAKDAYDNLLAATTAYSYAEGDAVFAMKSTQVATFTAAVSAGNTLYTTGTASKAEAVSAKQAIDDAYVLNAPDSEKRYRIIVAKEGHAKNGNAVVIGRQAYPVKSGDYVSDQTGFTFQASAAPAEYLAQAVRFIPAGGNNYNIVFEREEGSVYLTYGALNDSKVNWKDAQIQGNTNDSNKGTFRIASTTTAGVFNIINTRLDATIIAQTGGSLYTDAASEANAEAFTLEEADKASVGVSVTAGQFATRIFPFAPEAIDGITYYSCAGADEDNALVLEEVETPAANTPYILKATKDVSTSLEGFGTASQTTYEAGWLTGLYAETEIPAGSYVLQTQEGAQAFYVLADATPSATPYRAYLTVSAGAKSIKAFFLPGGNANAIAGVEAEADGNAVIYNVAGQRQNGLQKGINIVNGKKLFVK